MTLYQYTEKNFEPDEQIHVPDDAICVEKHTMANAGRTVRVYVSYLEPVSGS